MIGVFPSVNKDEGFFNDKDREYFKEQKIELAKGTLENLYEENFNIYKAFTTAEEKLYLSYAFIIERLCDKNVSKTKFFYDYIFGSMIKRKGI